MSNEVEYNIRKGHAVKALSHISEELKAIANEINADNWESIIHKTESLQLLANSLEYVAKDCKRLAD